MKWAENFSNKLKSYFTVVFVALLVIDSVSFMKYNNYRYNIRLTILLRFTY